MDVEFRLDRETKNTYLFAELDGDGRKAMDLGTHIIGSLYVQKAKFSRAPNTLTVTISAPELIEEAEQPKAKASAK